MNWDIVKGNWKQMKGQVKQQWGKMTDDDLTRIEGDLGVMTQRANAWAQGDTEAMRNLQARNTQWSACSAAMTGNAVARKIGMVDIEARVRQRWFEAAEAALSRNKTTFALLPVSQLLAPDGYLAGLAAKGYMIEEP